ncbi:DUF3597 domain-containing protein [Sphingomonas sp. LaA6.9]|uniref:DUF3597 domain-containing protein n=1 Tax=Sphingomonas sp. LaA6.9 TaxID=2919914 RepID=UPI001F4FF373|nr:DUF3597 domain-containing protein [Sphingomonas sp. LaA6.9]MCJ8156377.1 DUF3597 domain-containing protein [Sphingomonas sp. LaA6.9]
MSIFGKIKDAIFGKKKAPEPTPSTSAMPQMNTPSDPGFTPAATPAAVTITEVDVVAVLTEKAAGAGQDLNWRSSIVDLMKLLDLDSSLENRKELAAELGYTGDTGDSATMNIWLHKQVMRELAENGGIVPAELKD